MAIIRISLPEWGILQNAYEKPFLHQRIRFGMKLVVLRASEMDLAISKCYFELAWMNG
jgi:hypothetical protein